MKTSKSIRADMRSVLEKLQLIEIDKLEALMRALEAGQIAAQDNFGKPNRIIVNTSWFDAISKLDKLEP